MAEIRRFKYDVISHYYMTYNSIVVLEMYSCAAFLFLRWPVIGLFPAIHRKGNRLLKKYIKIFFETLDLAFKYDLIDTERFTSIKKEVKQMDIGFIQLLRLLYITYNGVDGRAENLQEAVEESRDKKFRKFLDRVVIKVIFDTFENEEIIQAMLKLARVERIIIVFGVIEDMEIPELALLLNTSADSVYMQKSTALKKLKQELKNVI